MKTENKGLLALFDSNDNTGKPIWSSDCEDNVISFFSVVKDFIGIKDDLKDFKKDDRTITNEPEWEDDE